MQAVVSKGPRDVAVEAVEDARIEQPLDAVIRITTSNVCGSDLHPNDGRAPMDVGQVFGHENRGVVVEVGPAVDRHFDARDEGWTKVLLHPDAA